MMRWTMGLLLVATGVHAGELKLELDGIGMKGKQVRVAIYSAKAPQQFPSDVEYYLASVTEAEANHVSVNISDVPPGRYAVAVYVDSNRNGRQEKNFMGVPTEDYGFSNNARGMFGPPGFADAAFEVGAGVTTQSIRLH